VAAVLVIDDDPDIRSLLVLALELDGHEVEEASSGAEGLEALRARLRRGIDPVVVLDVQLGETDGWHVLRDIRADPETSGAMVMLCTVQAGVTDLARGWLEGIDAYQSKPFDIAAVSAAVTRLATIPDDERRRLRSERAAQVERGHVPELG
jgi:two-component system OmpR family response regulator